MMTYSTNAAHGVVNTAWSKTALNNLETTTLTKDHV